MTIFVKLRPGTPADIQNQQDFAIFKKQQGTGLAKPTVYKRMSMTTTNKIDYEFYGLMKDEIRIEEGKNE